VARLGARPRILAGCRIVWSAEDESLLIGQAKLFDDPQLYGAEGLSALINRGKDVAGDRELALELATQRLQDVAAAIVHGLDWQRVPDFAWRTMVAAYDVCVFRRNRFWIKGDDKRAIAARSRDRQRAIRAAGDRVAKAPRAPLPPYEGRWYWQRKWRWPLARVCVQSKWVFDWNRAPALLNKLDYHAIANDPRLASQPGSAARCYITRADTRKFGELNASSPEAKKIKPLRPLADLRRLCRITIMHLSIASFEYWRDISFIKSILRNCFIVRGATVSEADHVVPGRKFSL
jgi:hypothetical protein